MAVVAAAVLCASAAKAQIHRIDVVVYDTQTGNSLSGVNAVVLGTGFGAVSDSRGRLVLEGAFSSADTVEISHIGYRMRRLPVDSLRVLRRVGLTPRAIEAGVVEIEAERELVSALELPAPATVLPMARAESRAVDLADLLRHEPSLSISESASGAKLISIRGGNADEVLVVYDGIRLNSSMTNVFDLSQIALTNLARVEVIKGSNTVLFGDGAFGGVLQIVPRTDFDRSVTVSQRFGTFRSNDLSVSLGRRFGHLAASYTLSRRQADRPPPGLFQNVRLSNDNLFHTLWVAYGTPRAKISGRYIGIRSDFDDQRIGMNVEDDSHIFATTAEARVRWVGHLGFSLIRRLTNQSSGRPPENGIEEVQRFDDTATILRIYKRDDFGSVGLVTAYERGWYAFDGRRHRTIPPPRISLREVSELRRTLDTVLFLLHSRLELARTGRHYLDLGFSGRLDWMSDRRLFRREAGNSVEVTSGESPRDAFLTYKFGANWNGELGTARYRLYVTNGANVKFPTLEQQFIADVQPLFAYKGIVLEAERNLSTELGLHLETPLPARRELSPLFLLSFDLSFFRNSYVNKIAENLSLGGRSPFNTDVAKTTGVEVQAGWATPNRAVQISLGYLGLNISNPLVYQYKPESKTTLNFWLQHREWSLWGSLFREGVQRAFVMSAGHVNSAELPGRWDIDLAVRQGLSWNALNGFVGFSVNNLRNSGRDDPSGLFLRDRRWYVTVGVGV